MINDDKIIGKRIKCLREEKNFTQAQLARKIGVSQRNVSYYENDKRTPPADILKKLASIFGITVDELIGANSFTLSSTGQYKSIHPKENGKTLSVDEETLLLYYKKYPSEVMELLHSYCSLGKKERTIVLGKCFELEQQSTHISDLKEAK